jgi:hypothetical protein
MPATAEGRRDLADMLAEEQQYAEAVYYYCEALRLKPGQLHASGGWPLPGAAYRSAINYLHCHLLRLRLVVVEG